LKRSCAPGGGACSVTRITSEFFTKLFSKLSDDEQEKVNVQQRHEHQWQNNHQTLHMFSVRCMATCLGHDQKTGRILPCRPCTELLNVCSFLTIINIPTPSNENYKYINKQFQNPIIGEQYAKVIGLKELLDTAEDVEESVMLRFARGIMRGDYNGHKVFLGLIHAMVQKVNREQRGVGMQHFAYTPAWDEFVQIVS
ncbi:hypothetical protein L208DRAFT_995635, partial [Tricholoma matsutake]